MPFYSAADYAISQWLFLRVLGGIYFLAFFSLWIQLDGLYSSKGLLPITEFMAFLKRKLGVRPFRVPSLFWLNSSDRFLKWICLGGIGCSAALFLDIWSVPCLLFLWIAYLSFVTAGQDFMAFQWDVLLLEIGFLSIFSGIKIPSSDSFLFLFWLILFRLMISSGFCKLMSGDPTWRNLTALCYHYETQPLPNRVSWYAHQLPRWFQKSSAWMLFIFEIGVPFFIFFPDPFRLFSAAGLIGLQVLILLTGNYCFFNLLTIGLCLLLLPNSVYPEWLSQALHLSSLSSDPSFLNTGIEGLAIFFIAVNLLQSTRFFVSRVEWLWPSFLSHFHLCNSYGLFAVMTTRRDELIIEGSQDGIHWKEYELRWKPGNLTLPPRQAAPHQPRLDWQFWFAALRPHVLEDWLRALLIRLFNNESSVLKFFKTNPFSGHPPTYLRVMLYRYHFTDWKTRKGTGHWWRRTCVQECFFTKNPIG